MRANANPIAGNWTPFATSAGFGTAQIVSDLVETSTIGGYGDSFYNAISWPATQYFQTTISSLAADAISYVGGLLRSGASNAFTGYELSVISQSGNTLWAIERVDPGPAFTVLNSGTIMSHAPTAGDVVSGSAVGSTITLYFNGVSEGTATDSTYSSGSAGFAVGSNMSNTDAQISAWAGGQSMNSASLTDGSLVNGSLQ